jgi:hypothetical protein
MATLERRAASRVAPLTSDDETVMVHAGEQDTPAKLIDLSESGTLVYLVEWLIGYPCESSVGDTCDLSMYNEGAVFQSRGKVVRRMGNLLGLEFVDLTTETAGKIQAKLQRLQTHTLKAHAVWSGRNAS